MPELAGRQGPGPLEDAVVSCHFLFVLYSTHGNQIHTIAKKYNKTPAQIILNQLLHRGISVIPKTNSPFRITENWDILFEMEEDDFKLIDRLMGEEGEFGVRNLEMKDYFGFDIFSEEKDEP